VPKQIQTFWEGLQPRQRLIAVMTAMAILATMYGISRVASAPDMALLYSGLDPAAAGEVIEALEADGVSFEVRDSSILVDRPERDRIRMDLAAQGLPAGGPAGYEILDGLSGFGTTSQMFDAAYWRAKEGELARTITAAPNVRSARVHLANPVSQPFSRTPTGSASVTVTMASGTLAPKQAEAIRFLVSSAVAGIGPEAVAVIDSAQGVVLSGAEDDLTRAGVTKPDERAETLRRNIQRMLEARVGAGKAIVEVNVDANMDSQTITERRIDPDSRVAISSETEESNENASGTTPGVTVASNLPDGDVQGGSGENSRTSSSTRERQNFEVSETRSERVILPGQVRRINVAVMVDGIVEIAPDGTESWAPRPQSEMETLRQLVQTAAGFDAERGDTVTIESLQFTAVPDQGSLVERDAEGFLQAHGARLVQVGVLAGIVLALIFFVLRPMLGRRPELELAELTGPNALTAPPAAALGSGDRGRVEDLLELPAHAASRIERLREVITGHSEDSAAVLRSWIESPDSPKEPAGS
jgi:flagellar M-ring protein FliF